MTISVDTLSVQQIDNDYSIHCISASGLPSLGWVSMKTIDTNEIQPVKNIGSNKPFGGLWLSPLSTNAYFSDWSEMLDTVLSGLYTPIEEADFLKQKVSLNPSAKVLVIDSLRDFQILLSEYIDLDSDDEYFAMFNSRRYVLDFEKITEKWDAIYLTKKGERETRFNRDLNCSSIMGPNLHGWDLSSVVVLNADIIGNISEAEPLR